MASTKQTVKKWLRLYTEVLTDPKVQMLPAELFKFWVNILCLARQNDGYLYGDKDTEYAWSLRMDAKEFEKNVDALEQHGLIDFLGGGVFAPHAWDTRQFESDNSTKRVQEYRDRQRKSVSDNVSADDITMGESQSSQRYADVSCNVSVTPPDTDTDTESPYSPPVPENDCFVPVGTEGDDFQLFDATVDEGGDGKTIEFISLAGETNAVDTTNKPDTASNASKAGRRADADSLYRALFVGFRRGKHLHWSTDRHEKIPESEYKQNRAALKSLHETGATPETIEAATREVRNFSWFKSDDQITVPTVARYWESLCERAAKTNSTAAIRSLRDDWVSGDVVAIAEGVTAVASHPKDPQRPLSTLRFPGMKESRHESIAAGKTPEWNGRRVNLTGNRSDTPIPGWYCMDGSWYTLDESGAVVACNAQGEYGSVASPSPSPDAVVVPVRSSGATRTTETRGHYSATTAPFFPGGAQC